MVFLHLDYFTLANCVNLTKGIYLEDNVCKVVDAAKKIIFTLLKVFYCDLQLIIEFFWLGFYVLLKNGVDILRVLQVFPLSTCLILIFLVTLRFIACQLVCELFLCLYNLKLLLLFFNLSEGLRLHRIWSKRYILIQIWLFYIKFHFY